jgi:signal transduction histidine kinase/ActR/RegA family two-component response regulator
MVARIRSWQDLPIAIKLAVLIVFVSIVPLAFMTAYNAFSARADFVAKTQNQNTQRARATAHTIDRLLEQHLSDVRLLARLPDTVDFFAQRDSIDRAEESRIILEHMAVTHNYDAIYAVDLTGKVIVASQEKFIGRNYITASWVRNAMTGKASFDEPRYDSQDGQVYIHFSAPVRNSFGTIVGAIISRVLLVEIDQIVMADNNFAGTGEIGVLMDEQGVRLSHGTRPDLRFVPFLPLASDVQNTLIVESRYGPSTATLLQSASNIPQVVERIRLVLYDSKSDPNISIDSIAAGYGFASLVPLENKRWVYGIFTPEVYFSAALDAQTFRTIQVAIGAGVLAIIAAWFSSNWITRQIRMVVDAANALALGDLNRRVRLKQRDEIGQMANAFDTMADVLVEKEQQLFQRNEELEQLLDLIPSAIWMTMDPDASNILGNRFANELLGVAPGTNVAKLVATPTVQLVFLSHGQTLARDYLPLEQAVRTGMPQMNVELRITRQNAETFTLVGGAVPLYDVHGRTRGAVSVYHDITERQKAEEALRASRDALTEANRELARASRLKDEFLANMSHELRTPLNAILGLAEGLLEQFMGPLNDKQLQALTTIDTSGRHLLTLINDILDLAKIEAGAMELTIMPFSPQMICESSMLFVKESAQRKNIQTFLTLDFTVELVWADERRLKQMLINLLTNAVKFTMAGGQVGLRVIGDRENNLVMFTVWDTGIGIAQEDLGHLFRPFVQVDGSFTRKYEGTGLGLSLVARMAEMHGGHVSVESELGVGSRFTITLPWTEQMRTNTVGSPISSLRAEAETSVPRLSTIKADVPHILVAEDNETNITTLSLYLEAKGYRLTIAQNGNEALNRVHAECPELILMDLQMPVMNGLEAIRQLRRDTNPQISNIPIIALTALVMPGDRERAIVSGANEYMSKPVNLNQLVETIERLRQSRKSSA